MKSLFLAELTTGTKKLFLTGLLTILSVFAFSTAFAYNITFNSALDSNGVLTTVEPNTVVWDFNQGEQSISSPPYPSIITNVTYTNAEVETGSRSGQWAAPAIAGQRDTTSYLEVGAGGSFAVTLDKNYQYLGLLWGSIDSYNSIIFYENGNSVAKFTGTDIGNAENAGPIPYGNQTSSLTNIYVNFNDLPYFDSFTLFSTAPAFEVDNIALDPPPAVPEPATMLLFGTGLIGLAVVIRKKVV